MKKHTGIVRQGLKRAAALGFPTVNISLGDVAVSGVYAAKVTVDGNEHRAAAFADQSRSILEAYLLDVEADLYGKEITIELLEKIRESAAFENDEALRAAIADDVARVRTHFEGV